MLDHVILAASDVDRSLAFYDKTLAPLGISHAVDFDGAAGPEGHPDLKGYSDGNRYLFWLREGAGVAGTVRIGFAAASRELVDAAYAAAIASGGTDDGAPGDRVYYGPGYYAANVLDPDGYSLEFVCRG
ncbi:VOC family protein [Kutzneria buriramensis]|uniref:Glyoxalase/bleomycin resistance protein/dioxygenase superfamily protein n=1 Tax=Kutzneria buriramensis TaxID=1045776 RepID=A0A3E0HHK4_9PSEU|nr:VOC family protein [Kutzneria buriramensis]REH45898.1 glyoxalase/bleomycin resistance protein/dioxygenase superfamily protein [Kutzneria buriramensis]